MVPNPRLDPDTTHPIVLHSDLYAEDARAPQTEFVRERKVAFLEALAVSGSVRAAARRVKVSHQTCYRARRSSPAFARAWDAALVVARGAAEAKLADFALAGVDEEVWYHGELVGHRKRFSERLLLAHLGRLDRMREDPRIEALAEDFDAMVQRVRRGEPIEPEADEAPDAGAEAMCAASSGAGAEAGAGAAEILAPGPCNTRSMSPPDAGASAAGEPACDCPGAAHGFDRGAPHFRRSARGWAPVVNAGGAGPCCDSPRWPQCRDCPHFPPVARLLEEMAEERPADAPEPADLGDPEVVEAVQLRAFDAGLARWWLLGSEADYAAALAEAQGCAGASVRAGV